MSIKQKFFKFADRIIYMISFIVLFVSMVCGQNGNFVPMASEATNHGTIDLQTTTNWSTNRSSTPGYFSAYGPAVYSGASDMNNINGYVKHLSSVVNQGFTFPIGNGTDLRSLGTSGTIPSGTEIATAWIPGNPSVTEDPTDPSPGLHSITSLSNELLSVSNIGQWDWISVTSSAGITVTVSIPDMSTFASSTELRLVGWNGTQWVNLSGYSGSASNTENSLLSGTMIDGITALGIGKAKSPDLSPTIPGPNNGSFTAGAASRQGYVQFTNGGLWTTNGVTSFRISKIANFSLSIPTVSSSSWGAFPFIVSTNNGDWQINDGPFFYTITHKSSGTTPDIPVGGNFRIGFVLTPTGPSGSVGNLTATVQNGTGGDNNNSNNASVRTFVIN